MSQAKTKTLPPQFVKDATRRYTTARTKKDLKPSQERIFLEQHLRQNPELQTCIPETIVEAYIACAGMGLSLNPLHKHVYLIPRGVSKGSDVKICYASPSYMGMIHCAIESGHIRQFVAEVVFEGDHFNYRGPMQLPEHSAVLNNDKRQEKHAIGVYTVARLHDGGIQVSYMDRVQILRARAMSDRPNALMWDEKAFWHEGWKKTAIRRAWKTLPRSTSMFHVEQTLDEHEGIDFDSLKDVTPAEEIPVVSTSQIRSLAKQIETAGHDPDKWLQRIARRFGVDRPEALPAPSFDAAQSLLNLALKDAQRAPQEVQRDDEA